MAPQWPVVPCILRLRRCVLGLQGFLEVSDTKLADSAKQRHMCVSLCLCLQSTKPNITHRITNLASQSGVSKDLGNMRSC